MIDIDFAFRIKADLQEDPSGDRRMCVVDEYLSMFPYLEVVVLESSGRGAADYIASKLVLMRNKVQRAPMAR